MSSADAPSGYYFLNYLMRVCINRERAGCRLEQACPHPVTTLLRACHPLHCPRWDSLHYPFLRGILDRDDDLQSIQGILRHDWTKPLFAISLWRCSCLHPSMQFRLPLRPRARILFMPLRTALVPRPNSITFNCSHPSLWNTVSRLFQRKGGKGSKRPVQQLASHFSHSLTGFTRPCHERWLRGSSRCQH